MKKIFIISLIIFLCTGCNVNYNLRIRRDYIEENIEINGLKNTQNDYSAFYSQVSDFPDDPSQEQLNNIINYEKEINNELTKYKYKFNNANFSDSNAANNCYKFFKFEEQEKYTTIVTSNQFYCFDSYEELDSVTVNIISDYEVIKSNADEKSGKRHTWYITKENSQNKPIVLTYNTNRLNLDLLDYIENNIGIILVAGTATLLVVFTILYIKKRRKRINKI